MFKVGDTIIIINPDSVIYKGDCDYLIGKVGTICNICKDSVKYYPISVTVEGSNMSFNDNEIMLCNNKCNVCKNRFKCWTN